MSDDRFSTHFDGTDPFAPETIDEQITARITNTAPTDRETHLTHGLATLNKVPSGADDSLARVRMRVRMAPFPIQTPTRPTEGNRPMISHQTPPSRRSPASPSDVSPRGNLRFRRTIQTFVAVTAVVLLIGGFYALILQRSSGPGGHPTATATSPAQSTPTATATTTTPTAPLATAAQRAACSIPTSDLVYYDVGNGVIVSISTTIAYPAFQLPEGTPLKPFEVSANPSSNFPQSPLVNPLLSAPGLMLLVCNSSQQPVAIQGVRMSIMSFTPYSGQLNSWKPCDGSYRGQNQVTSGCGGGEVTREVVHAAFAANAGAGTVVNAVQTQVDNTVQGYGPMPFTLPVGRIEAIAVTATPPTEPGTYSFGLGLTVQNNKTAFAPMPPVLLAPVTHKWDGQACLAPNMISQIPPETTPPTYYICPEPN